MPPVEVNITNKKKIPYNLGDEMVGTLLEELAVAGNTVELQKALGAQVAIGQNEVVETARLFKEVVDHGRVGNLRNQNVASAAADFLRQYGQNLAYDVTEVRNAITTKLMEIANCGDTKYELRALELLGKHSDIGLFTDRSEVTINYKDPTELENAIKARVKRLLTAEEVIPTEIMTSLEQELMKTDERSEPSAKVYEVKPDQDVD
jgi:hypothetical protein